VSYSDTCKLPVMFVVSDLQWYSSARPPCARRSANPQEPEALMMTRCVSAQCMHTCLFFDRWLSWYGVGFSSNAKRGLL
jgi:hypothetical protein